MIESKLVLNSHLSVPQPLLPRELHVEKADMASDERDYALGLSTTIMTWCGIVYHASWFTVDVL